MKFCIKLLEPVFISFKCRIILVRLLLTIWLGPLMWLSSFNLLISLIQVYRVIFLNLLVTSKWYTVFPPSFSCLQAALTYLVCSVHALAIWDWNGPSKTETGTRKYTFYAYRFLLPGMTIASLLHGMFLFVQCYHIRDQIQANFQKLTYEFSRLTDTEIVREVNQIQQQFTCCGFGQGKQKSQPWAYWLENEVWQNNHPYRYSGQEASALPWSCCSFGSGEACLHFQFHSPTTTPVPTTQWLTTSNVSTLNITTVSTLNTTIVSTLPAFYHSSWFHADCITAVSVFLRRTYASMAVSHCLMSLLYGVTTIVARLLETSTFSAVWKQRKPQADAEATLDAPNKQELAFNMIGHQKPNRY